MNYWPRICPVCQLELPASGNRRVYVPWKRGYKLVHAGAFDAQGILELDPPRRERPSVVALVRMRRLAQLLSTEHERRERPRQPFQDVHAFILRLARLDQPQVGDRLRDRPQSRLLRRDELLDYMRQLAHCGEVSAPTRTELFT